MLEILYNSRPGNGHIQFADEVQGRCDSVLAVQGQQEARPTGLQSGTFADPLCLPLSSFSGHADGPN